MTCNIFLLISSLSRLICFLLTVIFYNELHINEIHLYYNACYLYIVTASSVLIEYSVNECYRGFLMIRIEIAFEISQWHHGFP